MLTREDALNADEFHFGECTRTIGPRGGVTIHQEIYRRNGRTQTWRTRPADYRIPVKHGYRSCGNIWHTDAPRVHTATDCPLNTPDRDQREIALLNRVRI